MGLQSIQHFVIFLRLGAWHNGIFLIFRWLTIRYVHRPSAGFYRKVRKGLTLFQIASSNLYVPLYISHWGISGIRFQQLRNGSVSFAFSNRRGVRTLCNIRPIFRVQSGMIPYTIPMERWLVPIWNSVCSRCPECFPRYRQITNRRSMSVWVGLLLLRRRVMVCVPPNAFGLSRHITFWLFRRCRPCLSVPIRRQSLGWMPAGVTIFEDIFSEQSYIFGVKIPCLCESVVEN